MIAPTVDTHYTFSSVKGMNVYRIIQEAVNNALKYSGATTISVRFSEANEHLTIEISDNGKGFDTATVDSGNGLLNMKKRAREIGGTLEIASEETQGTTIVLNFPKHS